MGRLRHATKADRCVHTSDKCAVYPVPVCASACRDPWRRAERWARRTARGRVDHKLDLGLVAVRVEERDVRVHAVAARAADLLRRDEVMIFDDDI